MRASALSAGGSAARPSSRHSHSSIAPGGEHAAVDRVLRAPADPPGDGRQQAARRPRHLVADVGEDEHAGAVGRLHAPGHDAARAGERRLLVDDLAAQRQLHRPRVVAQRRRARPRCRARRAARRAGTPKRSHSHGSKPGVPSACSCVRDAVEASVAKPAPSRGAQERVDGAHAQRAGVARPRDRRRRARAARRAWRPRSTGRTAGRCAPGSPPRRRARRSSTSCERLSCQTTIGDSGAPVSASQASTDSPWWSSPQATTSPGRVAQQLGDRVDDGGEDLLAVLLDPAGPRMAVDLVAPRLAHRAQALVEERGLDRRRALVDAEDEPVSHATPRLAARGALPPRHVARPGPPHDALLGQQPRDMLADAERRGQAGGADRGDVDQARARPRRPDDVVDAAPGRAQAGVREDRLGALERRQHRDGLGHDLVAGLGAHRPVVLVLLVVRRRPGDDLAVDGREHQHSLRALGRHRQQDALERPPAGGSKTKNSPLRG